MSVLLYYREPNGTKILVEDTTLMSFNFIGEHIKTEECNPTTYLGRSQMVVVLSILDQGSKGCEIFITDGRNSRKHEVKSNLLVVTNKVIGTGKFFASLKRRGTIEDIRYTQMIYVYPKGTDIVIEENGNEVIGIKFKNII